MTFIVLCEKCREAEADEEGTCQMTQAKARALQACFVSGVYVCVVMGVCVWHMLTTWRQRNFKNILRKKKKTERSANFGKPII